MDEQIEKIEEFKKAFSSLAQKDGWRLHQWSAQKDEDGFFLQVTLRWQKPGATDQVL